MMIPTMIWFTGSGKTSENKAIIDSILQKAENVHLNYYEIKFLELWKIAQYAKYMHIGESGINNKY